MCCKKGELIGCNRCPAAYHRNCIPNSQSRDNEANENDKSNGAATKPNMASSNSNSPTSATHDMSSQNHSPQSNHSASTMTSAKSVQIASNWTCEDCLFNKRPLHGDIVWAKVGMYRWWPAQVCIPRALPENIRERSYAVGEFPVKFFGTNDFYWVSLGRCFAFAEGDECHKSSNNHKSLELAFKKGVRIAKAAFKEVARLKASRAPKTPVNKYNFAFIKTNRPYGNVSVPRIPLAELPKCDCDITHPAPCSSDSRCMNRMLKYECHPATCPAGDRCQNQRFTKRLYPKQEQFYTGSRGWGLRTLVDLKKGDFINEYVGEIIDDEECKRRLNEAHENNNLNFYFMTIKKDMLDKNRFFRLILGLASFFS